MEWYEILLLTLIGGCFTIGITIALRQGIRNRKLAAKKRQVSEIVK